MEFARFVSGQTRKDVLLSDPLRNMKNMACCGATLCHGANVCSAKV